MLREHLGLFPKSLFRKQQQYPPFLEHDLLCKWCSVFCRVGSALEHSLAVCIRERWSCTFNTNQCCSKVTAFRNESISSGQVKRLKSHFHLLNLCLSFLSRKMWILCPVSSVSSSASTIFLGKGNSSFLPISNLKYSTGAVFHENLNSNTVSTDPFFLP